jgi:hypothetical protein
VTMSQIKVGGWVCAPFVIHGLLRRKFAFAPRRM